jgi:hypothetical protein
LLRVFRWPTWLAISLSLLLLCGCKEIKNEIKKAKESSMPDLDVQFLGSARNGILDYYFWFRVWHQHTGTIKNGKLTITVSGDHLKEKKKVVVWSFDSWSPNQSEAKTYDDFILDTIGPDLKLTVRIDIESADTRPYSRTCTWSGNKWN